MKRALRDPIIITIVVVGLVVTVGLTLLIRHNQRRDAATWLAERAELISRAAEDTVASSLHDLTSIAAYLATSETTSQAEFAEFVEQMEVNTGVAGIAYAPAVNHSDLGQFVTDTRKDAPDYALLTFDGSGGIGPGIVAIPVHYPIRYLHVGRFLDILTSATPVDTTQEMLGFDIASEPLWRPALEHAAELSTPSVSDLIEVGGDFSELGFVAMRPVLSDTGELDGMLIAAGLDFMLTSDIDFSITSSVEWSLDNGEADQAALDWPVWRGDVDVPGATWALTVTPTEEAIADLESGQSWLVLAVGLGLTGLLVTVAGQMRLRRGEQHEMNLLRRASEDKDRFLAAVSHELRTPLTVVIGLSRELARHSYEFDLEETPALLELIGGHSEEVGAIVDDLLVAARSDIGNVPVTPQHVDLRAAVDRALASSTLTMFKTIGEPATAWADAQRVRQILRNLLTNAHRYGGRDVEIRFMSTATSASVVIADSGQPIPRDKVESIFDPYVSAHGNDLHHGSIGLGLYISLKLARLMGGDIQYRHDGRYSLFILSLPLFESATPGDRSVPVDTTFAAKSTTLSRA